MKRIKDKTHSIKFSKKILDKLNPSKPTRYYDILTQGLGIYVGRKKSYFLQASIPTIKSNGNIGSKAIRKVLCGYDVPVADVKAMVRDQYDDFKTAHLADINSLTVGGLVHAFIKEVIKNPDAMRLKQQNRLQYKPKTLVGYWNALRTYVLGEGKTRAGVPYKKILSEPIRVNNTFHTGLLRDIPLNKVTNADVNVWMQRLRNVQGAANHALTALSVAFEYDLRKPKGSLCKNNINPCQRVNKFSSQPDKRYLTAEKYLEIRSYIENNLFRDPLFFAYYILLVECGERQSDIRGLYWKAPLNNLEAAKKRGCTGWLNLDANKDQLHIIDSKNRKSADVTLTKDSIAILKRVNEMRYDKLAWCVKSDWVFPRAEAIDLCISENSYRKKLDYFHFKFDLAVRELIRSTGTKRKLYKYKLLYSFKHLRKTFATQYARVKGVEATQQRMRHSSLEVTQKHYVTPQDENLVVDNLFSPREERKDHKLRSVKGGLDE